MEEKKFDIEIVFEKYFFFLGGSNYKMTPLKLPKLGTQGVKSIPRPQVVTLGGRNWNPNPPNPPNLGVTTKSGVGPTPQPPPKAFRES